jgi:hypothetical protein
MTPHRIEAHQGPTEILTIFDHDGEQAHLPGHSHQRAVSPLEHSTAPPPATSA